MANYRERGQTLLIVVLVMVVALTVGLSVASRSITNLKTSKEEESSQRAFSAAEAGVERALKTSCSNPPCVLTGDFIENKSSFNTSTTILSGAQFLANGGNTISKDDGVDIWLTQYPDYSGGPWNGNLTIYWGDSSGDCSNAALEVIVISGTKSSPRSKRDGFDPCNSRRSSNKFSPPSSGGGSIGGKNFAYKKSINNISQGLIVRIIPLYYSTSIGVSGGSNALPSQGTIVSSTGASGTTSRKITVFQGYPSLPSEFFQYILFAPK